MSTLDHEIDAVNQLSFVADAYPYKDNQTIVVVLKAPLRKNLPPDRSILTFQITNFTVAAVLAAYEHEVVAFLADTLRIAETLLSQTTNQRVIHLIPLCMN
ncbi:hypothetical protein [Spirosoma pollinicola]|uniref:Uncharacterized protein n=1 Tax=Spirosoma pollinicola TaxID=2057025 RepID=A0A2K8Z1M5_9BACT|nr:hypothetical protein [Spirosoma pollinicola]AUD03714.1 hypothetical protein CWM47_18905 [Spirosoma pollinicola]